MASTRQRPRGPAEIRYRVVLSREQRDWINAAAAALEQHAGDNEDPLAMLEAAAELRRVVGEWDLASDSKPAELAQERLRAALRQIADAESGVWGWIARRALDGAKVHPEAIGHGDTGALGNGAASALEIPGGAIAARPRGHGGRARG